MIMTPPIGAEMRKVQPEDLILVTGATGFIGPRVAAALVARGCRKIRCLVRASSDPGVVAELASLQRDGVTVEIVKGNLLARADCGSALKGVAAIAHLATARGGSFPDAFMHSVVTTRNLLEAAAAQAELPRLVNVSSIAVYTNRQKPHGRLLDETCPVETQPQLRGEPYVFAKVKQDQIVAAYADRFGIPVVTVRPGYVFGPGKCAMCGRVGTGAFGLFMHLGGSNRLPVTYVDNCADAIAAACVTPLSAGSVYNVVDDDLPTSRQWLKLHKAHVDSFRSLYLPHAASYLLSYAWESYSRWSEGQLPPVFNREAWHAYWKRTRYSNHKAKSELGWRPLVPMSESLKRYFDWCATRSAGADA
jgi:nucleoside-diphosphate-sugar epimerase